MNAVCDPRSLRVANAVGSALLVLLGGAADTEAQPLCPTDIGTEIALSGDAPEPFGIFGAARTTQAAERAGLSALKEVLDTCRALCPGRLDGRVWVDTTPAATHRTRTCPSRHLGVEVPFSTFFLEDDEDVEDRWIQDILRGRNAEGRALEAQCPGHCSYAVSVSRQGTPTGRSIDMVVECVPPRRGLEWLATYRLEVMCGPEGETPTLE